MSSLLLEFSKQDESEILKDQETFTISYEIELDSDGNMNIGRHDLADYVSEEDIRETAESLFEQKDSVYFLEHLGIDMNSGVFGLFKKWIEEQPIDEFYEILLSAAHSLDLLGESASNIEKELFNETVSEVFQSGIYELGRKKNAAAIMAFAEIVMEDSDIREFIENSLDVSIPDPQQLDIFGEESKLLHSVGERIINKIERDYRRKFFQNIFGSKFDSKSRTFYVSNMDEYPVSLEKPIDYFKYIEKYINLSLKFNPNTPDESEEDQEIKENKAQIYSLISDFLSLDNALEIVLDRIDSSADVLPDLSIDIQDYDINTFSLSDEIEESFNEWIQEKFDSYQRDEIDGLEQEIDNDLSQYFDIENYIGEYDISEYDIEGLVASNLPRFYRNWGSDLKYELDGSLVNGIEISSRTYLDSIEEAFEFLEDFYEDYDNQSVLYFSDNTGLHTNIGIHGARNAKWNYFKGFLFLNDNFATRGFDERLSSRWSKSIRKAIINKASRGIEMEGSDLTDAIIGIIESNFEIIENAMNSQLSSISSKEYGFSIRNNRIEFRYPGGDVSFEDLKNATLYYAYIVKLITDPNYKRREYLKRAISFILNLKEIAELSDNKRLFGSAESTPSKFKILNIIKKEISKNTNPEAIFKITNEHVMESLPDRLFWKTNNSPLSVDTLLNLEDFSISDSYSEIDFYNYVIRKPGLYTFFKINDIDSKKELINISLYFSKRIEKDDLTITNNWPRTKLSSYEIYEEEITLPINVIGSSFFKGHVLPVSQNEYSKIKLLSSGKNNALNYFEKIFPWFNQVEQAIFLMKSYKKIFFEMTVEEFNEIISGDFSSITPDKEKINI